MPQRRQGGKRSVGRDAPQLLEGVRVLDVGMIVAGPFAASMLADFGADVIKIERPGVGDPLRWPYRKDGVGLLYKIGARNKRCVTLDMGKPQAREVFHRLVAVSDVVVENFRPGVMERWGHAWSALNRINAGLIYCRLSGFGQTGPLKGFRSYGRIGEAFSGFTHLNGEPDGPPMHSAVSLGDTVAGLWAALGVMMALYWRDARGGTGQVIDLGLYEPLFRLMEQHIVVYDQLQQVVKRQGNRNPGAPYLGLYETKDGRHFSISAGSPASIRDMLLALGLEGDPRFSTFHSCAEHADEFQAYVTTWMRKRTLADITKAFERRKAPGTPALSAEDLYYHPHIRAREMIVAVDDPELGNIEMQGGVPKFSRTPGRVRHAGQPMGASNREVYGELLGMAGRDLQALRHDKVI